MPRSIKKTRVPPKTESNRSMTHRETRKKERRSRNKTRKVMAYKEDQSTAFVDLCNADIMNTPLEFVEHKSWLSKGKVNIFIIGELHSYRNYTETGIFEMFDQLIEKIKASDIFVDIMLEISEGYTNRDDEFYMRTPEKLPDDDSRQIDNVRNLFRRCVGKHNCGKIRAHWVDNMNFSIETTYKTSTKFKFIPGVASAPSPSVRTALAAMPPWLKTFYEDYKRYDDSFQAKFKTNGDLYNLLYENTIVLKEIEKAVEAQRLTQETPIFNRKFAITTLDELIKSWTEKTYREKIFDTARAVMDIYTVARIIKSHMKNVIIYEGAFHAENVVYMLTKLGYTTNKIERRDVGPVLDTPVPLLSVLIDDEFIENDSED